MADTSRYQTAQEVVEQVDLLCPNQYSQEQKLQWLGELEGRICLDVHLMGEKQLEQVRQSWPGTLLVGWPHSDVYRHWLLAKLHQADGELSCTRTAWRASTPAIKTTSTGTVAEPGA